MFDILFQSAAGESLTLSGTLAIIGSALLFGFVISLVYMRTHKKEGYTHGFAVALIMLPAIIAMIILLVGNNVARAFSLTGAFSLIRFRSAPGDSKDIAYVFFTLGVGLACGMGYIGYAALFAVIMCCVMMVLTAVRFGKRSSCPMQLKIVMPEHIDYYGTFDEVMEEYTESSQLMKVKTSEFGSLFELSYEIWMKDVAKSKEFIDKIRCRNGNLNIVLTVSETNEVPVF